MGDDSEVAEQRRVAEVIEEELPSNDDNGRLTGVFVSGNVVNLSRKVLSEGEVKLLSRGAEVLTNSQRYRQRSAKGRS